MFKKLSVLIILVLVIVLSACGRRETVTICEVDEAILGADSLPGYSTVRLEAVGDRVVIQADYIHFEIGPYLDHFHMDLEEAIEFWEFTSFLMPDGLTIEVDSTDTHLIIKSITDFEEMSQEDLAAIYGVDDNVRFISLRLTLERIEEEQGGTCQVQ